MCFESMESFYQNKFNTYAFFAHPTIKFALPKCNCYSWFSRIFSQVMKKSTDTLMTKCRVWLGEMRLSFSGKIRALTTFGYIGQKLLQRNDICHKRYHCRKFCRENFFDRNHEVRFEKVVFNKTESVYQYGSYKQPHHYNLPMSSFPSEEPNTKCDSQ